MIIIETDLDFETAKKKFLKSVEISKDNFKRFTPAIVTRTAIIGNIDSSTLWFDSSCHWIKYLMIIPFYHEFDGELFSQNEGGTEIKGSFSRHLVLRWFVRIYVLISLLVDMFVIYNVVSAFQYAVVITAAAVTAAVYLIVRYIYNAILKNEEEKALKIMSDIFEAKNTYIQK